MPTTKERILAVALELFNTEGFDRTTTRHIAAALGISHGNLCYHFSRREDIALVLYNQMAADTGDLFIQMQQAPDFFGSVYEAVDRGFRLQCEYRFIFFHRISLYRRLPEMNAEMNKVHKTRFDQFRHMLQLLENQRLLLPEPLPGQWDRFAFQLYMLIDSWIYSAEIRVGLPNESALRNYVDLFVSQLVPYLNADGLAQFTAARNHYLQG